MFAEGFPGSLPSINNTPSTGSELDPEAALHRALGTDGA